MSSDMLIKWFTLEQEQFEGLNLLSQFSNQSIFALLKDIFSIWQHQGSEHTPSFIQAHFNTFGLQENPKQSNKYGLFTTSTLFAEDSLCELNQQFCYLIQQTIENPHQDPKDFTFVKQDAYHLNSMEMPIN